ncbi:MAG TPA: SusD/RagB family nutrient-binding outer membrane lipoprotein [Gemmatimonadales bacterium]|nr:SusD/RagB family nutrient-binding outer membrane lipoprotein [Gemmatimonadales bacterium]
MRTSSKLLMLGALLAFGSAACGDFLSGPGLTTDPNAPSNATRDQRLASVQSAMTVQLTGTLARSACMWMQQCAGVDRQYATLELYNTTSTDFDTEFIQVYTGGGLIDIKAIEADAAAAGDLVYEGIGRVLEALDVGTAADLWGDIPYSQAAGSVANPKFDTQQSVYTALLAVLDSAIAELGGAGSGPGAVDLWYAGNATEWKELAHTLKARIYLHLAARNGTSAYTSALAEARQGLSTGAHDLRTYQSAATTENNIWYQFQIVQRDTYLRMGAELVDSIMNKRADPRRANYFSLDGSGVYAGAHPGQAYDPATESNLSATRLDPAFRQPLATHAEVQLIIAEAAYQTGDFVQALDSLNAERTAAGLSTIAAAGVALLDSIMTEKYVVMFQNIETWNDLKRECIPALLPASAVAGGHVISRPFYGATEESANPNALPDPTSGRNWNDPRAAADPCP